MKRWILCFAVLCLGIASGCSAKKPVTGNRLVIDQACITAPVELKGCDFSVDPPRCKQSKIQYRKGCERVVVGK